MQQTVHVGTNTITMNDRARACIEGFSDGDGDFKGAVQEAIDMHSRHMKQTDCGCPYGTLHQTALLSQDRKTLLVVSESHPGFYQFTGSDPTKEDISLVPDSQTCAMCGAPIATAIHVSHEGVSTIDTNPRSEEVAAALRDYVNKFPEHRPLPETRHPMCHLCFIGWLHVWLDIDSDKQEPEAHGSIN